MAVKVKATARGYYGFMRDPGDVFDVASDKHVSKAWMEVVEAPKPAKDDRKQDKPEKGQKAE